MRLYLVRHGETDWNRLGKFQGQVDVHLNNLGLVQARETARAALAWEPTAIYASPLTRTMQVAEEIAGLTGLAVVQDPRLMELDLGDVEGVSGAEMRAGWPEVHQVWRDSPELAAMPGGESLAELEDRVWRAFVDIERTHGDDDNIVVVSHNFAIRAMCGKLAGIPLTHFHRLYLHLASASMFQRAAMGWRLITYNSTHHLSTAPRAG